MFWPIAEEGLHNARVEGLGVARVLSDHAAFEDSELGKLGCEQRGDWLDIILPSSKARFIRLMLSSLVYHK